MGKENVCKHFHEDSPCGFARWLIEKPYSDIVVPNNGCGRLNTHKCPRIISSSPKLLNQYGPVFRTEFDIALPENETNSKGDRKRLPGGTFK